jgi:hypothetical protein
MPKDFTYYVYYWITGKSKDNIDVDALSYEAPFKDMESKEEIYTLHLIATFYTKTTAMTKNKKKAYGIF